MIKNEFIQYNVQLYMYIIQRIIDTYNAAELTEQWHKQLYSEWKTFDNGYVDVWRREESNSLLSREVDTSGILHFNTKLCNK